LPDIVEYQYKVPLFNDIATFQDGDVLILGGVPNAGKTTIAMNMIREMVAQGVEPYYLFSESGSRYQNLAKKFGIEDKYYYKESLNPLTIELKEDAFTIIDWLDLGKEGFEKTSIVLEYLGTEMRKRRGILVIFTQLKVESYEWFAPNLIEQYPTLSAKYMQDSEDKTFGHWDVRKIKEPKGNFTTYSLPCEFNHDTKIFQLKSLI
jgi:tRNA A37 threonylcarbamoyladenosine biosynthesis protein TsaE